MISEAAVVDALRAVRDPSLDRDIVSLKFVKDLAIDGGRVSFTIETATAGPLRAPRICWRSRRATRWRSCPASRPST